MEKSLSTPDDIGLDVTDDNLYTNESKIGAGTYAEVFRVSSPEMPLQSKAVKRAEGTNRRVLQKEWRILKSLDHPNIVKVTENFWTSPTRSFMVMEYVRGGDLFCALEHTRATIISMVHISKCVLSALKYIHTQNLFHKDLKLENILIGERDINRVDFTTTVKICDFGLSAKRGSGSADTAAGSMYYAAPEILLRTIAPRAAADMYSFSVVFYALCFSSFPYGEKIFDYTGKKSLEARMATSIRNGCDRRKTPFDQRCFRKIYKHTSCMDHNERYSATKVLKMSVFSKKKMDKLKPSNDKLEMLANKDSSDRLRLSKGPSEGTI